MFNTFKNKDPEYEKFLATEREVKQELNELSVLAQQILTDSRYARFSELVKQAEGNTIELCLQLHKQKIEGRYQKYDEFLTELGVYRNILRSVVDLATNKPQPKKNIVNTFKNRMQDILNNL